MAVCGVDGCPGGWLSVHWDGAASAKAELHTSFKDIVDLGVAVISVDMPIGLPERIEGRGRACEHLVRKLLGDRQSSVFAIPCRAAVMARDYREACAINLENSDPPRKISKQAFNLFPKIREIDALFVSGSRATQELVYETHPEVCFWTMNDQKPVPLPKKIKSRPSPEGLSLRRDLLRNAGFPIDTLGASVFPKTKVGEDDIIDACAACWTAWRIHTKQHMTFPNKPERDGKGLRMEINA
ncbi:MAG: DUF429 domain-containing protein [Hyphomicrobiales bacterium]